MLKFIHAGDLHLDSPFLGLQRYEGAPVDRARGATRQALTNLVDLALREKVAFVLFAGDLYDSDWRDYNTGLFFIKEMGKLRDAGIKVIILSGNHDAASQITKSLRLPAHVKMLSDREPESILLKDYGVAIHGQGFQSRAVRNDLSATYPDPVPHYLNIGLLHTSVDGRDGHDPYAPCSLQGLLSKSYDYWALGHVHKREILHEDPWVVFCGNTQGRNIRETGSKGCTIVEVKGDKVATVVHQELDILRWSLCEIDCNGAITGDDILDRVELALQQEMAESDGRAMAVRVQLTGACAAHRDLCANTNHWTNQVRGLANNLGNEDLWIEKVEVQTRAEARADEMFERNDALGGLLRAIRDFNIEDHSITDLAREFNDLRRQLPGGVVDNEQSLDFKNPGATGRIVEDVRQLLLTRLFSQGDTQ